MNSKRLPELQDLKKNSLKLLKDYRDIIVDVIAFGSYVRNKYSPNDVDIAILFKNTNQKELLELRPKLKSRFPENIHLNLILLDDLFYSELLKTFIEEGVSLVKGGTIQDLLGYSSNIIYSISLKKLEKTKKVLFYYALKGNKLNEGLLKKLNGTEIGRSVLLIPISKADEFKEFLENWNVEYKAIRVLKNG
jgi:predicted nucleotidyltransferase